MMATRAATLPSGADWSYEVKWDGYRAQGVKRGASVSLASRNLKNITPQFPAVAQAVARLRAADAVVDGENRRARSRRAPVVSGAAPLEPRRALARVLRV